MSGTTTTQSSVLLFRPSAGQSMPRNVLKPLSPADKKKCMICGRKDISAILGGQLYQLCDVTVHHLCILLSSKSVQNGEDHEGIWGFLLKDIKAEIKRGSREICIYCKKTGATISCGALKCKKIFHLPCGLQHGSMHQYYNKFKSFCRQHSVKQTVGLKELHSTDPVKCVICKVDVRRTLLPSSSLWAPCCKHNAWFHRNCIQQLALSSGYSFKCPLCNNNTIFKTRMLSLGIYIPSRDASWEMVPNAFAELLERHSTCNAETCLCPHSKKRNYVKPFGYWEIILCHTCGLNGTHRKCSSSNDNKPWYCSVCQVVVGGSTCNKTIRLEITEGMASNGMSSTESASNE